MVFSTAGVDIQYQKAGAGAPVLLLHGWGGCADSMRPFFDLLAKHRTVYALDFPGHGESGMPPRPWSVGDYADATLAFMRAMGILGCDVVAHSFGGRVVIKLASRDEGIFSRIVLIGVPGARKKRTLGYYRRVYGYKLGRKLSRYDGLCKMLSRCNVDIRARIANAGSEDYRNLPEGMKRTFSLIVNENLRPLLARIKNPTLLIWGEKDAMAPLWIAQAMEKEIADSGLVTYLDAGHFVYLDRWAQVAPVVSYFLINGGRQ